MSPFSSLILRFVVLTAFLKDYLSSICFVKKNYGDKIQKITFRDMYKAHATCYKRSHIYFFIFARTFNRSRLNAKGKEILVLMTFRICIYN